MDEKVLELEGKLIRALVAVRVVRRPRDLVDRRYSFYYRCCLSKEDEAVSIGKIIAIEFEEKMGIILCVSHTRLNCGAEVRGIILRDGVWCLAILYGGNTTDYPGVLEIH